MIEKESLTHRIEDDLERRNRNWDIIKAHLRNYTEQVGNPANLTTVSKEVVSAINELKDEIDTNKEELTQHKLDYASQRQQDKLKVTKVEKELNDFKGVINQVNINQEPKQKATGYGVISLPPNAAEGQINDVVVKGLTVTNLVKNGDFRNGTQGWNTSSTSNYTVENNIVQFIANSYRGGLSQNVYMINGHKYYISAFVKADTNQASISVAGIGLVFHTGSNNFERLSNIFNWTSTTQMWTFYIRDERTENWATIQATKCFLIDLTALGLEDKTVEELDAMFPYYFEGTKSTVSAIRVRSVGKNLFDFKKNGLKLSDYTVDLGDNYKGMPIKLIPNTTYTVQRFMNGWKYDTSFVLELWQQQGRIMLLNTTGQYASFTFTTDSTGIIYLRHRYGTDKRLKSILSTIDIMLQIGETATPYEPYQESTLYIQAKDEEGNIIELHSLPNGVADRIYQAKDGQWYVEKNTKEYILQESDILYFNTDRENFDTINIPKFDDMAEFTMNSSGQAILEGYNTGIGVNLLNFDRPDYVNSIIASASITNAYFIVTFEKGKYSSLEEVRADLAGTQLIYQLAEPIEMPVQTSGSLTSYPSGTIYVENVVADAGIYTDKMEVLYSDLPIKALEKISKIDFDTGLETELDITAAVIAEDKLSFTHPDLSSGDIVFFVYEHSTEGTIPETEISYYDSRYVVKDTETGKFYKWHIVVANGVPSIELEEV